jgi:translation initiation factor eIF-2B subunit gamma
VITDVYIHYLADLHRSHDATMTVLLQDPPPKKDEEKKKSKKGSLEDISQQYAGLDGNRLVFFKAAADIEEDEMPIHKAVLKRYVILLAWFRLQTQTYLPHFELTM